MGTYTGEDKRLQYLFQNSGGGGTTVIANPQGQATDTLNKLQVGSTIYDVLGGGAGNYEETVLIENTNFSSAAGTANITKTYTLLDSLDNYDAVIVYGFMYNVKTNIDNNRANLMSMMVFSSDFYDVAISQGQPTTNPFLMNGSLNSARRSMAFQFPDSTHIMTVALRTEAYVEPILYKVVGLKFGGASGHIYSTTEKVVGKWIDNKPIYETTIQKTNVALSNGTTFAHNIANLKMCIKIVAVMYDSSTGVSYPFTSNAGASANTSKDFDFGFGCNASNIICVGNNSFVASATREWSFTLQYTKTTD